MNSRHKMICIRLLSSGSSVTLKQLSEELKVSIRTVQRELKQVRKILAKYDLQLDTKTGVGIHVIGSTSRKNEALHNLTEVDSDQLLSSEQRQYRLKQILLSLSEPVKLFYLSRELGVSEATISYDLGKIENWFQSYEIELIRKPGVGVYVDGDEKQIRKAIIDLFYDECSKEELVHLLEKVKGKSDHHIEAQLTIWNDLFHFIEEKNIRIIESVVKDLKKRKKFFMSDSALVGMVVHIALAVQRLKAGEGIEMEDSVLSELKQCEEYGWAAEIAEAISATLQVSIPESEKGYITMHLLGSRARENDGNIQKYPTAEYTRDMIYLASDYLKLSLIDDEDLFFHLSQHLESALFRISMSMNIRNPMLDQVKKNYPEVYDAACHAVKYLERRTGLGIPPEEIGYLAMHIGAAVLRKERNMKRSYQVIVVCTSGMGTSKLLAAQIRKELPNIEVIATVPLLQLNEWSAEWEAADLVISTIPIDFDKRPVVEVSPFLSKEDCLKIETRIAALGQKQPQTQVKETRTPLHRLIQKVNIYGETVSQILENFQFVADLKCKNKLEVIQTAAQGALLLDPEADTDTIEQDLLQREQMGIWIAETEQLALIHFRTKGIHKLLVALYRLTDPVAWSDNTAAMSILVLLAPENAPLECLEIMGEISASLIEEDNVERLARGTAAEIEVYLQDILSNAYTMKVKHLIGGHT